MSSPHPALARLTASLAPRGAHVDTSGPFPAVVLDDPQARADAHRWLRERACLIPRPDVERVRVEGPDRARFLQGLVTRDVNKLAPGEGCHGALLTLQGKMESEPRMSNREHDLLMELPHDHAAPVTALLDRYLIRMKARLIDESHLVAALLVAGPHARAALARVGACLPDTPLGVTQATLGATPVEVVRTDWLGPLPAAHVWTPIDALESTLDALLDAVTHEGGGLGGHDALELARLEAGVPRHGVDIDANTIPLEAGLRDLIDFTKGCYLGQEIIARVDARGAVARHLVGLTLDADAPPTPGAQVCAPPDSDRPGKTLGAITSAGLALDSGRPIALAWVRRGFEQPGTRVLVGPVRATVRARPLA